MQLLVVLVVVVTITELLGVQVQLIKVTQVVQLHHKFQVQEYLVVVEVVLEQ